MMNATIKTMDVFAQVVKEAVEASLGDGYEVSIHEVLKNNDTHLTGLTIRTEESNVAPTIYLEGSFERYKAGDAAVPVIVSEILSVYESHKTTMSFDASLVTDFSACKERICYKLVNADRNRELLADAPHIIVCDDLAVAFIFGTPLFFVKQQQDFRHLLIRNVIRASDHSCFLEQFFCDSQLFFLNEIFVLR